MHNGQSPVRHTTYATILRRALGIATAAALLAGCSPTIDVRGNLLDPDAIKEAEATAKTRADIARLLGTPSAQATFGADTWYYIGNRTETTAFRAPEVLERRIVVVRFDETGKVTEFRQLDASDGKEVALVDRVTPTKGKELGLLEQLVGNLGRFSSRDNIPGVER